MALLPPRFSIKQQDFANPQFSFQRDLNRREFVPEIEIVNISYAQFGYFGGMGGLQQDTGLCVGVNLVRDGICQDKRFLAQSFQERAKGRQIGRSFPKWAEPP